MTVKHIQFVLPESVALDGETRQKLRCLQGKEWASDWWDFPVTAGKRVLALLYPIRPVMSREWYAIQ